LKREIQEEALRKGLIPYIPEKRPTVEKDDEAEVNGTWRKNTPD
jgi:hypothetical protein